MEPAADVVSMRVSSLFFFGPTIKPTDEEAVVVVHVDHGQPVPCVANAASLASWLARSSPIRRMVEDVDKRVHRRPHQARFLARGCVIPMRLVLG